MTDHRLDPRRRGPGRPRTVCTACETGRSISAYLPSSQMQRLQQLAQRSGESLSATVRRVLVFHLEK